MLTKYLSLLALVSFAFCSVASANDLTVQDVRERLQLNADVYKLDASGKKILAGPKTTNSWRPDHETGNIKGDWSSSSEWGALAIRYNFHVEDDGSIKATIEEYGQATETGPSPVFKDLLDKKEFVVENLEPIIWKIKNIKSSKFVARFSLSLKEVAKPSAVENLPVAGTGISVSDNFGYLWADGVDLSGRYAGFTTHRGTLVISYLPFTGAKELGVAEGPNIKLTVYKGFNVTLKSATSFLPAGVIAKVYAIYVPEKKSKGFNSVHTFDTSKEERIQEILKK